MLTLQPIERRTGISNEDFETEFLKPLRPMVFTDLIKDWPAQKFKIEIWTSRSASCYAQLF